MTPITFKVNERIAHELDLIKKEEGLGNRTSTFTFLIKYYFLTKKESLEESVKRLERLVEKIDFDKLPSAEEQLKDV